MARKSQKKELKPVIAIYCEGQSEVEYFNMLRRKYRSGNVRTSQIKIKALDSMKGTRLITEVIKEVAFLGKRKSVDAIYAVFDRDDLENENIQKAQALAKEHDIKIIFSSINFEVWILLHFKFFSKAYTKDELNRILSDAKHFDTGYSGFKGSEYDQYLIDKVATAIQNARRLQKTKSNLLMDDPFVNVQDYIKDIFGRED